MATHHRPTGPPLTSLISLVIGVGLLVWGLIRGQWWVWLMGAAPIVVNVSVIRQQRLTQRPRPLSSTDRVATRGSCAGQPFGPKKVGCQS